METLFNYFAQTNAPKMTLFNPKLYYTLVYRNCFSCQQLKQLILFDILTHFLNTFPKQTLNNFCSQRLFKSI
jgi:hypothetical protein